MTKFEKFKQHVKDHPAPYIIGGVTVGAVAGAAFVYYFGPEITVEATAKNTALLQWKPFSMVHQDVTIEVAARGHRGFPVWDAIGKEGYGSVKQAADALGATRNAVINNVVPGADLTVFGENLTESITVPA